MAKHKNRWYSTEEAEKRLKEILQPGDDVYVILKHVSSSGMFRVIDVYTLYVDEKGKPQPRRISGAVADFLGWKYNDRHEGVAVSGVGMDMGFHLCYELSYALFKDGYALNKRWL